MLNEKNQCNTKTSEPTGLEPATSAVTGQEKPNFGEKGWRLHWDARDFLSCALGPDVMEDECGDNQTKKDSNNTVADVIEICIRRVTLKDAVEESECARLSELREFVIVRRLCRRVC